MNERIQELWRQCVVKHTKTPMNWQMVADDFAELIVRECVDWCDAYATVDGTAQKIAGSIKEHFGVSE
jgi:hypothetical protein